MRAAIGWVRIRHHQRHRAEAGSSVMISAGEFVELGGPDHRCRDRTILGYLFCRCLPGSNPSPDTRSMPTMERVTRRSTPDADPQRGGGGSRPRRTPSPVSGRGYEGRSCRSSASTPSSTLPERRLDSVASLRSNPVDRERTMRLVARGSPLLDDVPAHRAGPPATASLMATLSSAAFRLVVSPLRGCYVSTVSPFDPLEERPPIHHRPDRSTRYLRRVVGPPQGDHCLPIRMALGRTRSSESSMAPPWACRLNVLSVAQDGSVGSFCRDQVPLGVHVARDECAHPRAEQRGDQLGAQPTRVPRSPVPQGGGDVVNEAGRDELGIVRMGRRPTARPSASRWALAGTTSSPGSSAVSRASRGARPPRRKALPSRRQPIFAALIRV